jgi:hypothetical protein
MFVDMSTGENIFWRSQPGHSSARSPEQCRKSPFRKQPEEAEEKCSWSADGYQAVVFIHTLHKMPAAAGEGIAILIALGDVAAFQDDRSLGKKSPLRFAAAEKQGERKQK